MKLLWILAPGVHYLTFLLFYIFFAGTSNIGSFAKTNPSAPPAGTSNTDNRISTASSLATTGPQSSSTSDANVSPTSSTAATSTGTNAATDTTSPETEKTTHSPAEQPLKFWGIILISLTVTAVVTAGCVGCCFFCTKR